MATINSDQLAIRSFSPDQDNPRILSLRAAVEAVDQEGIEISEVTLRAQLNLPGHDPLNDRWVIEAPGDPSSLIAYALIRVAPGTEIADTNVIVHPDWRHQGIGSLLLERALERALQHKATSAEVYVNAKHPAGSGFLRKHKFTPQGAYTELRLAEDVRLPPVIWPFGYTLNTYAKVQDLSILTEAMNLCYLPLWGHHKASEEQMAAWLPEFNQQGLFLVFSEKGRVIGISRVEPSTNRTLKNEKPTGYIDAPGIVPQHRRLDLYRALVLTGIRWLHDQGQTCIEMESWGDKLEVLKMYRELGFKDIRQLVCYQINLLAGDKTV
jgi:mycothiol synthase